MIIKEKLIIGKDKLQTKSSVDIIQNQFLYDYIKFEFNFIILLLYYLSFERSIQEINIISDYFHGESL